MRRMPCRMNTVDRFRAAMRQRARRFGLLARFSALSILAFAIIGIVVARVLDTQMRDRALDDAARSAALVARFGIQPQLSPADLQRGLAPEAIDSIDRLLAAGYGGDELESLTVFNRDGRIVYATDHHLIGRRWTLGTVEARTMMLRTSARVVRSPGGGAKLVGHVPLRFGAQRADGAFEIEMPYAPVAAAIRHDRRRLYT